MYSHTEGSRDHCVDPDLLYYSLLVTNVLVMRKRAYRQFLMITATINSSPTADIVPPGGHVGHEVAAPGDIF